MSISLRAAALLACAMLGGCSPLARSSLETLGTAISGPEPLVLSREQVDALPFDALRIDSPLGNTLLAFAYEREGRQVWVASSKQVLMLEDGLVVRSLGFPQDLDETRFVGVSPFHTGLQRLAAGATYERHLDVAALQRFDVPAISRFEPRGREVLDILGTPRELLRVDEDLRADGLDLRVTNRYWVDPQSGFIVASLQHLSPEMAVFLTQVRPPRAAQGSVVAP